MSIILYEEFIYFYEDLENDSFVCCYVAEIFLVILINILLLIYYKNYHGLVIFYLKLDYCSLLFILLVITILITIHLLFMDIIHCHYVYIIIDIVHGYRTYYYLCYCLHV